jgi:hypothetical protein
MTVLYDLYDLQHLCHLDLLCFGCLQQVVHTRERVVRRCHQIVGLVAQGLVGTNSLPRALTQQLSLHGLVEFPDRVVERFGDLGQVCILGTLDSVPDSLGRHLCATAICASWSIMAVCAPSTSARAIEPSPQSSVEDSLEGDACWW